MRSKILGVGVGAMLVLTLLVGRSGATLPYTVTGGPFPLLGPGVILPHDVGGKEYSHNLDATTIGAGAVPPPPIDPEQVIAWDGLGGALDGLDYSGSRPGFPEEREVDAIANRGDFLFNEVVGDVAHLVFSHDDVIFDPGVGFFAPVAPSAGPLLLSNGDTIGGAGEISIEESGVFAGFEVQGLWAADTDVNGMPAPIDVDGVEVWGPEPAVRADADKYSLEFDIPDGVPLAGGTPISVFSYDIATGGSIPYVDHPKIVAAVTALLGAPPTTACNRGELCGVDGVNLDALMVQDRGGSEFEFEPGDEIIFSINQMFDFGAGGYYATGSELFVLDGSGAVSFLKHGLHTWDPAYALGSLSLPGTQGVIDINAIEAISEGSIPEPTSALIALSGVATAAAFRRR